MREKVSLVVTRRSTGGRLVDDVAANVHGRQRAVSPGMRIRCNGYRNRRGKRVEPERS
jgi:hypothetical protein